MLPRLHSDPLSSWLHYEQEKHENRQKWYRLCMFYLIRSSSANKDLKLKDSFSSRLWRWSTSRKIRTRPTFKPRSISSLNSWKNTPHTLHFCLTSLKSSFKSSLMHPSSLSIFSVWSKTQRFLSRLKSPFHWHCIFQTENKSQKLGKKNSKKSSRNSEKLEKETIFLKKYLKRFFSKSIKIQFFKKNLETNSITCLIIAKTLKKSLKPKFTSISNVIGNTLPLNRSQSKSHQ